MEQSDELVALTRRLYRAVEAGDTAAVERHVSQRPDALFIGTDPGEWWQGAGPFLAALRAQAEAIGGRIRITPGELRSHREGDLGWVVDDGPTFRFPDGNAVRARHTLLYRREDGAWRLVHEHASFGVPNATVIGGDVPG
jgi:ketosteroid isomerase-like protein